MPVGWKELLPGAVQTGGQELPGAPPVVPFSAGGECPPTAGRVLRSLVFLPPEWQQAGASAAEGPLAYVHRRADMPAYCVLLLECRERVQTPEAVRYVEWLLGTKEFANSGLVILLPGKQRKRPVLGVSLRQRSRAESAGPLQVVASLPSVLPEAERACLEAVRGTQDLQAVFAAWCGVVCRYALQNVPLPGLPAPPAGDAPGALALYREYRQLLVWFRESMHRSVTDPAASDAAELLAQLAARIDALRT